MKTGDKVYFNKDYRNRKDEIVFAKNTKATVNSVEFESLIQVEVKTDKGTVIKLVEQSYLTQGVPKV